MVSKLSGVYPVLCTPFSGDGAVDYASLERLVAKLLPSGIAGLVLFGLASEGPKLTSDERAEITKAVVQQVAGKLPVVTGAEHASVREAARLAERLEAVGASAIMSLPPSSANLTMDAVVRYYCAIDSVTTCPVIIQDAPSATGVTMSPELLARIFATCARVDHVKVEAPRPAAKMAEIRRLTSGQMVMLGGLGGQHLMHELAQGSAGTMIGCAFPSPFVDAWRAWQRHDFNDAWESWVRILPLIAFADDIDAFVSSQKLLLVQLGVFTTANVREPAATLDQSSAAWFLQMADRILHD